MKTFAILAVAAFSTPLAAFAGGPVPVANEPMIAEPMPVAVAPPSGEWGGFYGGAQVGYGNITSGGAGLDGNGAIGGLHAGYRYDFGRAVVGGELDYNVSNIDLGVGDNSLDSVARLKLMAGADLGRALVYVTAGAASAEATIAGSSASDDGYFAGIGVDYQLTDTWTVGGELIGHRFEDFDGTGVDVEATTVQAKVAYRF